MNKAMMSNWARIREFQARLQFEHFRRRYDNNSSRAMLDEEENPDRRAEQFDCTTAVEQICRPKVRSEATAA